MTRFMHRELIRELGGPTAVAREIRQPRSVVSNWTKRGIPWRWRAKIKALADDKKIDLPADFLEPDQAAA